MNETEKKIIECYEQGIRVEEIYPSYFEIAKKVGCSKTYVYLTIKKYKEHGTKK